MIHLFAQIEIATGITCGTAIIATAVGYGSLRQKVSAHEKVLDSVKNQSMENAVTLARIEQTVMDIKEQCVQCSKKR